MREGEGDHLTTELQRAMLARMGIDVWVRRRPAHAGADPRGENAAHAEETPADADRDARVENAARPAVDPPPAPVKARARERTVRDAAPSAISPQRAADISRPASPRVWTALAAGTVVFIGEITAAPQLRRLAQDIVLAAARFPQETVVAVAFEDAARNSEPGASSAVLAFVRGQIDRRRARLLIVTNAAAPVLGLETAEPMGEPRWMELYGVRCVDIGDLEQLRLRPEWKRNLWRALSRPQ